MSSAQSKPRAPRRSSAEIRRLLLEAARVLFEEQGYQATTTQQIVDRARVDAPTLYRHFSSKADLFEEATLGSLKDFLAHHFEYWRACPPGAGDTEALVRHFVAGLLEALEAHRESLRLLMASSAEEGVLGELARTISRQFREGLVVLRQAIVDECDAHGYRGIDSPDATLAAAAGMVLSMTLFGDWVFPAGEPPSREARIDEIAMLMLHGVAHRPDRESPR